MERKYAVLVVDMLNDFVTGALKCDRGLAIVPKTKELLAGCREKAYPSSSVTMHISRALITNSNSGATMQLQEQKALKLSPSLTFATKTMLYPSVVTVVSL